MIFARCTIADGFTLESYHASLMEIFAGYSPDAVKWCTERFLQSPGSGYPVSPQGIAAWIDRWKANDPTKTARLYDRAAEDRRQDQKLIGMRRESPEERRQIAADLRKKFGRQRPDEKGWTPPMTVEIKGRHPGACQTPAELRRRIAKCCPELSEQGANALIREQFNPMIGE
ncbi:hypothetical protein FF098_014735 [Parvularcula flava]|nr:hypothetical protein [Aquisalinus luteolus]NHK29174.1 hypothetical protein [Aquisalinus luteolus]